MNPDDLDRFLTQSLADRKFSGGEKSALADWLAKNVTTDQHRGLVRHTAFEAWFSTDGKACRSTP